MTDNGWIKLHRKLLDSPIWANSTPEQKTVLITILLSANYEQKTWDWNGKEFKVEPGQFVTSLQSLQKKCGKKLTPQKLRTSLKRFEKLGFLTIETTNAGSLISITKWDTYQSDDDENNKQNNKHLTNGQQTLNKRLTTNKNNKNIRIKEYIPPLPPLQKKLIEKITDIGLTEFQDKIIEFFKYRMSFPKAKRYKTEKGLDGLLRDITGCIAAGLDPVECLDVAMEREWLTPSPKYFRKEKSNGTNFSKNDDREATDFPARDLQIPVSS